MNKLAAKGYLTLVLFSCAAIAAFMALEMLAALIGIAIELRHSAWPPGGYLAIAIGVLSTVLALALFRLGHKLRSTPQRAC